jgi:hypothetical protein
MRDVAVHLVAIGAELLLLLGTLALTVRLAEQGELAISAFVVYAVAIVSLIISAVAGGLIDPSIAIHLARTQGSERDAMSAMFTFTGYVDQAFARLGFSLAAVAIILWSTAMLRAGFSRNLGIYGVVVGPAVLVVMAVAHTRFALHGVGGLVMAGQLGWTIAAGVLLRRS